MTDAPIAAFIQPFITLLSSLLALPLLIVATIIYYLARYLAKPVAFIFIVLSPVLFVFDLLNTAKGGSFDFAWAISLFLGIGIYAAEMIAERIIEKLLPRISKSGSVNDRKSSGKPEATDQFFNNDESYNRKADRSYSSKPKRKTKTERRREESDQIWAEIMQDEEELDDDEL